jgi:hypothetical protein
MLSSIEHPNKHYNIDEKDEGTYDAQGRAGGTNFLRITEKETRRTLHEHDDNHDDDNELLAIVYALHKFKIYMVCHTSFSQKCTLTSNSDAGSAVAGILHTDKSLNRFSELPGRYNQSKPYANDAGTNEAINEARDIIGRN